MNIYLSRRSPINTNELGQVLYKVDTPYRLGSRTSTIWKIIPNESDPFLYDKYDDSKEASDLEDEEKVTPELSESTLRDRFTVLATVEHKLVGHAVLKFDGKTLESKDYFRKAGLGIHGQHRVFTGPDGREYKWLLNPLTSNLCQNDAAQTPVARFHQKSSGFIGKKHPAYLEILPEGAGILDTIMITFIHVEKKRKDMERIKTRTHGGGP